ncbi:MAG: FlgD immunoglobulin-like domain containing protein [Bacteroidota bacterium]|nr:FlgD immunoglobulin-like domain containing protein [Bacteroidota bacterium]
MTTARNFRVFKRFIPVFAILLSLATPLLSQPLHRGEWKTYTAMNGITDLAVVRTSGNVWAVTTGGAFRFSPNASPKDNILALRNSDGLSDNDLTAVAADSSGRIYFGGITGTLDIYTESSGKINAIHDIVAATQYARRNINSISVFGTRVYIATGFGLSIYDNQQNIFTETVTQFGSQPTQDTVFSVTESGNSIYAIVSGAVAVIDKTAPNLSDPLAWHIIPAPRGATLNSVIDHNGSVIVGSAEGIYDIKADTLHYISTGDSISVVRLASSGNTLYVIDSRNGKIYSSSDLTNFSSASFPGGIIGRGISSFALTNANAMVFGDDAGAGAVLLPSSGSAITGIYPDGPLANLISDLHFAGALGKLYISLGNVGLSVFDPAVSKWTGFAIKDGALPNTNINSTFYDTVHSKLWLNASGGGGLGGLYSWAAGDPSTQKHYGFSQGVLGFGVNDSGFHVMGKGTLDYHGNYIVPSFVASGNDKGLIRAVPDGNSFTAITLNQTSGAPFGVCAQDVDDIYYVGTVNFTNPAPIGIIAVLPGGSTQVLAGGNGEKIGSSSVNALIVDQDNGLWCGTNVGVDVLTHSRDFATGNWVFNKPRRLVFTDQQFVKTIAVDGVGNKWVGTDDGVFILNADGSDSLAHFTTANSPLIDNSIQSITIDPKNGEAYIGTSKGISRYSSIYQQGAPDYSNIYVYPNPVIQNSDNDITVTITGLASGSTVKIFSASGRLVRTIDASQLGSTVTWNGRDDNNKLLNSGVYIAAAASTVATDYGETKFVVIRK